MPAGPSAAEIEAQRRAEQQKRDEEDRLRREEAARRAGLRGVSALMREGGSLEVAREQMGRPSGSLAGGQSSLSGGSGALGDIMRRLGGM